MVVVVQSDWLQEGESRELLAPRRVRCVSDVGEVGSLRGGVVVCCWRDLPAQLDEAAVWVVLLGREEAHYVSEVLARGQLYLFVDGEQVDGAALRGLVDAAVAQAHDILRVEMAYLQEAISQVQDSVLITKADLDFPGPEIVYVNRAFSEMSGYTSAEVIGKSPRLLQGKQTDKAMLQELRQALAHHQPFSASTINYRKDGSPYRVAWHIAPVFMPDGKEVSHFISIQRDVTETWETQRKLERQKQLLESLNQMGQSVTSQRGLRGVLDDILAQVDKLLDADGLAILLHDEETGDLVFSAVSGNGAIHLAGFRMSDNTGIAGHVFQEQVSVMRNHGDGKGHDLKMYDAAYTVSQFRSRSLLAVPLVVGGQAVGVIEAVHRHAHAFTEEDQTSLEMAGSWAAIAIRNALLYELEQTRYEQLKHSQTQLVLMEKVGAIGRLASSVAHEINNPIQIVHSFTELMSEEFEGEEVPEKALLQEWLDIMQDNLMRVAQIVQRLQHFYRRDGRSSLTRPDVVWEEVLALASKKLSHSFVSMGELVVDELPAVNVSEEALKQIFLGLLLHLADTLPTGSEIVPEMWFEDGRVYIALTENASLLDEDDLKRLVDPLRSLTPDLFVVQMLIEAQKGTFSTQKVGDGVRYSFDFPLANERKRRAQG